MGALKQALCAEYYQLPLSETIFANIPKENQLVTHKPKRRGNYRSDTSLAARHRSAGKSEQDKRRILEAISNAGAKGATCFEIETALGMKHATASARISELYKNGDPDADLVRIGTRLTDTGSPARVYRLREDIERERV